MSVRAGMETGDVLIQPTMLNPDITFPTGQKTYQESVAGHEFRVASPSFFQVNIEQTARLAGMVRDILDLTKEDVLLDAYTGVGTFAVLLSPFVKRVIAVEESAAAMVDARENANDLENIELVTGKTEDVLPWPTGDAYRGHFGPAPGRLPSPDLGKPCGAGSIQDRLRLM